MKYSCEDLKKISRYEEKRGIKYAKSGGKLYKYLLFFGFVSWLWMVATELFFLLGKSFVISDGGERIDNVFITLLVAFAVTVLSIPVYAMRFRIAAFAASIIGGITSALSFARISVVDDSISSAGSTISEFDPGYFGLKKMFYWRHGIPALLVTVLFATLIIITVRERRIMKKEYELIAGNLYSPQFASENE